MKGRPEHQGRPSPTSPRSRSLPMWPAPPFLLMLSLGLHPSPTSLIPQDGPPNLATQIQTIARHLETHGQPWNPTRRQAVSEALGQGRYVTTHELLTPEVMLTIVINPEGRVKLDRGTATPTTRLGQPALALVRIENHSGGQQQLEVWSRYVGGRANPFTLRLPRVEPFGPELRGWPIEYRLLEITPQRAGRHELTIGFNAGQGSQDLGFRGEAPVLFQVLEEASDPKRSDR